jgi:hypothetical protein
MNETLHPLEDVMHEALPPSNFYPFTPAELAPADQHTWYVPSGEFIHVMKIKVGHAEPGLRAAPSRDVVKSTRLMARNDLPIGSGYVPAFEVLKLMTLLGRAVGEEVVFKEVFSDYLQRFRSPLKLMPNWRTIQKAVGDTERFHEGLWYGMGDRPHVHCDQLVGKAAMIYTEIVGVNVQVESTHPTTGAVQRRWARIPVLRESNRGKIFKKGRAKDRQCDLLGDRREFHAAAVATQIRTGATIFGLYWPGEHPLDVNDFDRRRFDRACEPLQVKFSA